MRSIRLQKMLGIITGALDFRQTPYALVGTFALNLYGGSRYTADLDLIADQCHREEITASLEKAGFHCRNETSVFARFESENDLYGRVECMFIRTREGRDILRRCAAVFDFAMGIMPVVQPTDYIMLKLMSMANQPGGSVEEEADIRTVLECYSLGRMPDWCDSLDKERIEDISRRFGQEIIVERLFQEVFEPPVPRKVFAL